MHSTVHHDVVTDGQDSVNGSRIVNRDGNKEETANCSEQEYEVEVSDLGGRGKAKVRSMMINDTTDNLVLRAVLYTKALFVSTWVHANEV